MTLLLIEVLYQVGVVVYCMIRRRSDGFVWNTALNGGDGGFEAWNAGNWAQYAIPMTEQASSGYYTAAYPANIGATLTSEAFFARTGGTPAAADAPAFLLTASQGGNVAGVAGSATAAVNLGAATGSQTIGAIIGTPTATVLPTDLTTSTDDRYIGRILIMTSGVAVDQVQYVISYDGTTKEITLAAPLISTPAAADTFIIV